MKLIIAMPSRATRDPLVIEGIDYLKRIKHPLAATHIFTTPKKAYDESQAQERMSAEGQDLIKVTKNYYRIALSERGQAMSSPALADFLDQLSLREQKVAFIIGGAFGLSAEAEDSCQKTLSLSKMTMPHRMAFMFLCEQLYRTGEIKRGTPYHK